MFIRQPRIQRGITLIEILLVVAIVAASAAAIFVFSKKASVTAAVEAEQRQVEQVTKTVQGLFATQSNFAALGTSGASYLKDHAARSGLKFSTNADRTSSIQTGLGDGQGTLTIAAADVGFDGATVAPGTANGFVLTYAGLSPAECIGLVTSTAASTAKTQVGHGGVLPADDDGRVALRGHLEADKGKIAESCQEQGGVSPTVFLFFAPARNIGGATAPAATPAAACAPVHESQYTACPSGQVGTIRQERDGTCTGANNAMVYTVWTTTDNTCQVAPGAPVGQTATDPGANCATSTFTKASACPAGQVGQITQQRTLDGCTGVYSPWSTTSDSCQPAPPAPTCVPQTKTLHPLCPAGQGGEIVQSISSTCSSPNAPPTWSSPITISNTCSAACTLGGGNCCVVKRAERTTTDPCPAGSYGNTGTKQEQFLGCADAMTQAASWTPWQTIANSGSCTACPATTTNTETQWDPRTQSCASGETGSITFKAEQTRTQNTSYNCPAGTTSLPAPTVGAWSAWMDTGATKDRVDTCTPIAAQCTDWDITISGGNQNHGNGTTEAEVTSDFDGDGVLETYRGSCSGANTGAFTCDDDVPESVNTAWPFLRPFLHSGCGPGSPHRAVPAVPGAHARAYGRCLDNEDWAEYEPSASCTAPPPTSCDIPAGQTFNWTVSGNACSFTQATATSVAINDNFPVTDGTAPTTGAAAFACSSTGTLATTPNAGATCSTAGKPTGTLLWACDAGSDSLYIDAGICRIDWSIWSSGIPATVATWIDQSEYTETAMLTVPTAVCATGKAKAVSYVAFSMAWCADSNATPSPSVPPETDWPNFPLSTF